MLHIWYYGMRCALVPWTHCSGMPAFNPKLQLWFWLCLHVVVTIHAQQPPLSPRTAQSPAQYKVVISYWNGQLGNMMLQYAVAFAVCMRYKSRGLYIPVSRHMQTAFQTPFATVVNSSDTLDKHFGLQPCIDQSNTKLVWMC